MAYLTIITGTHAFTDLFGTFEQDQRARRLYKYEIDGVEFKKRRMDRVVITKEGDLISLPSVVGKLTSKQYMVSQTMGSGKTILGVEHLARTHKAGLNTGANMSIQWFPSNIGADKPQWVPNINSMDDMQSAKNITLLFDDIRGTITRWNANEADMISSIVNASRKESVNLILTTQRVIKFVPPDIREVATNYEIPIITIRDMRKKSPDKMGFPLEMEILNISAGGVFQGFGLFNGFMPDGATLQPTERLLNSYSTLEIAVDLKGERNKKIPSLIENSGKEPYRGYFNERNVVQDLEELCKGEITHIARLNPQEHYGDIEFVLGKKKYMVDSVSIYKNSKQKGHSMATKHKDMKFYCDTCDADGYIPVLAYPYKKSIKYINANKVRDLIGDIQLSKLVRSFSFTVRGYFK